MDLDPEKIKDFLTKEEYGLYKMIWDRFVGSQMKPALFDVTDADITVGNLTLRASGEVQKFAGFLAVFQDAPGEDDEERAKGRRQALLPDEGAPQDHRVARSRTSPSPLPASRKRRSSRLSKKTASAALRRTARS